MSFIAATEPTVVPPVPEKTFDKYWIQSLTINATDPPVANLSATLRKFRATEEGGVEFSPEPGVFVALNDLLTLAQTDAEIAQIMGLIYAKMQAVGTEQGVL